LKTTTTDIETEHRQGQMMPNTLVVGGGLAGLATAAALRNIANIDAVHVVEKMCDTLANESAGAAIQLGPNAFKALEVIGGGRTFLEKIYEAGSVLEETLILLPGAADGTVTPTASIPNTAKAETGYPIVLVRWGVLRKLLGELLPEESLSFGTGSEIVGYAFSDDDDDKDNDNNNMNNNVEPVNKEGKKVAVDGSSFSSSQLIIGADGLHSVFRERVQTNTMMVPVPEKDSEQPVSSSSLKDMKRVNIKAVVPVELKELGLPFTKEGATFAQFSPQLAGFAGPAGKGHTYWAISVADDEESGSKFLSSVNDDDDYKAASKKLLLEKLEASSSSDGVDRKWIISLVERTDSNAILINRSLEAPVKDTDSFVSKDTRVVLVGDAAHAMSASYGQSASFAFEDAATLALLLKENNDNGGSSSKNNSNNNNNNDVAKALQDYSDKRTGRCMEMQRRSEERAGKAMRGEKELEDVSKWVHAWEP